MAVLLIVLRAGRLGPASSARLRCPSCQVGEEHYSNPEVDQPRGRNQCFNRSTGHRRRTEFGGIDGLPTFLQQPVQRVNGARRAAPATPSRF
jgi:hypothetical protein